MKILLDTNIIIDFLNGNIPVSVFEKCELCVSVITESELLRYPGVSEQDIDKIERFLMIVKSIPVSSSLARFAAELGRTRKTALPDLLIAATAIQLGIPLMTRNKKDFNNIPDLELYPLSY